MAHQVEANRVNFPAVEKPMDSKEKDKEMGKLTKTLASQFQLDDDQILAKNIPQTQRSFKLST